MRYLVVLLLLCGCANRVRIAAPMAPDPELTRAAQYVDSIAEKMPEWDADEMYARYERAEIEKVKADIAAAKKETRQLHFLEDVAMLNEDWDALVALDGILQRSYVL